MSGKTVDERILSMKFDNSSFEKNAKTTINTLNKLNQSLDVDKLANGMNNLYNYVRKIGTEVKTFIAIKYAIKGISSALKTVTEGGKRRAMNLENARFQLQGLLKDEEKVAAVMDDVNKSVDGTAYSLDAAAKVASQLAASNIQAGDQMFTALRAVAGVAAMTNSSYEDIGRIFTQVAGQGRLMGDQLLQLSGRGMNAAATLAEEFGLTEAVVREMVSKGQISFDMFAKAMDSAFGEHAKKANDTLTGALSNVKSALGRIGALFYSPLVEQNGALVEMFNALRVKINELKTVLAPSISKVVDVAIKVINWATSVINGINFEGISKNVTKPFEKVNETITDVVSNATDVVQKFKDAGGVISDVINGKWDVGTKRWDKLTEAGYNWITVQNGVNEALGSSYRHADDLSGSMETLNQTANRTNSIMGMQAERLSATKKTYAATKRSLTAVSDSLSVLSTYAVKAGYSIDEVTSDTSLLTFSGLLLSSFSNILKIVKDVGKAIVKAWNSIFGGLKNVNPIYDLIAGFRRLTNDLQITDDVADKLERTFKGLFAIFDILKDFIAGGFTIAVKALRFIFETFGIKILDVTAAIGDMAVRFRDWFKTTIKSSGVLAKLQKILKKIVTIVVDAAKGIYNWAKENEVLDKAISALSTILSVLLNIVDNLLTRFINWIKTNNTVKAGLNALSTGLGRVISGFMDWVSELKNAENIPEYIIQGFVNGFGKGFGVIGNIVSKLAEFVITTFNNILGIHSPSVVFYESGGYAVEGFIDGVIETQNQAYEAVSEFGNNIAKGLLTAVSNGVKVFADALPKLINNIATTPITSVLATIVSLKLLGKSGVINKTMDTMTNIIINNPLTIVAKGFQTISDGLKNVSLGIKDLMKSAAKTKALKATTQLLYAIAVAVGVLAASIFLLSKIDESGMTRALIALGVIAGVILAMVAVLNLIEKSRSKFNKGAKNKKIINDTAITILSIAASFTLIAIAMKALSSIKKESLKQVYILTAVISAILIALALLGPNVGGGIIASGKNIAYIAVAFYLMAKVIKIVGKLDDAALSKGVIVLGFFTLYASILIFALGILPFSKDVSKNIIAIGVAFLLFAEVIKILSKISERDILKGISAIKAMVSIIKQLLIVITAINYLSNMLGGTNNSIKGIGSMVLGIGVAFLLLALTIKIIAKIKDEHLIKGVLVLEAFALIIAEMIYVSKFAGKSSIALGGIILMVALSMVVLALVAAIIGLIPLKMLYKGVTVVAIFGLIISGLMWSVKDLKANSIKLLSEVMGLVIVMAIITVIFSIMDTKQLYSAVGAVAIFGTVIAEIIASTKLAKSTKPTIKLLQQIMILIGIMGAIIIAMSLTNVDGDEAIKYATAMAEAMAALSASMVIMSHMKKGAEVSTKALASLTIFMVIAGGILVLLAKAGADGESTLLNATALSEILLALTVSMLIMSKTKSVSNNAIAAAYKISGILLILGGVLALMGLLNVEASIANAYALSILIKGVASAVSKLKDTEGISGKAIIAAGALSVVLILISVALAIIAKSNPISVLASAIALVIVLEVFENVFTRIVTMSSAGQKIDKSILAAIIALGIILLAIAAVFRATDGMDPITILATAVAMKIIFDAVETLLLRISALSENSTKNSKLDLIALAKIVVVIGMITILMSAIGTKIREMAIKIKGYEKEAIVAAISIGIVLAACSLVIAALMNNGAKSSPNESPATAIAQLAQYAIVIGGVCAMIPIIAASLNLIKNDGSIMEKAKALSLIMLAITPIVLVLGIVAKLVGSTLSSSGVIIGVLAVVGGVILSLFAIVGVLALMQGIDNALFSASILVLLLNTISSVLVTVALVAPLALIGSAALVVLTAVLVELGVFVVAIGFLVTKIPEMQTFIQNGASVMILLAETLGKMIGAFITGIAESLMSILPAFAQSLSDFAANLAKDGGFIETMRGVDDTVLAGAMNITAAILALCVAQFVEGIATLLPLVPSLFELGLQLTAFAIAATPFIATCKTMGTEGTAGAESMANMILAITKAQLLAGIGDFLSFFSGDAVSMDKLCEDLLIFGQGCADFSAVIAGKIDSDAVKSASLVADMMVNLAGALPKEGGFVQQLIGTPNLEGFADGVKKFGEALVSMNNALVDENGNCIINKEAMQAAADAGEMMCKLEKSLPRKKGWVQKVLGQTDLGEFGKSCLAYGIAMVGFNMVVTGPDGKSRINKESVQAAADAGAIMNELNGKIPTSGGWWQNIAGEKNLGDFGESVKQYGEAMVLFSDTVIDESGNIKIDPKAVDAAYYAGATFASLTNSLAPSHGDISKLFTKEKNLKTFGEQMASFGESVVSFNDTISGKIDENSKTKTDDVAYIAQSIIDILPSDNSGILNDELVKKFGENFKTLGEKLGSFGKNVSGIDTTATTSAAAAIADLAAAGASMESVTIAGASSFSSKLTSLADAMSTFNVTASTYDFSGLKNFAEALVDFAGISIDNYTLAYKDGYTKLYSAGFAAGDNVLSGFRAALIEPTKDAVKAVMDTIKSGLEDTNKVSNITIAAGLIAGKVVGAFNNRTGYGEGTQTNDFYNIGNAYIMSLINGMRGKEERAVANASDISYSILDAIANALGVQSPSRKTEKIGEYVMEGFVNGVTNNSKAAASASANAMSESLDAMNQVTIDIFKAMDLDTDYQPTIRPILDLSDVESGSSRMKSVLSGFSPYTSFGLATTSNDMYNTNRRNTISALDILNSMDKTPENVNNYTINGVTYDDGSTVANAVKQLVNAVIIRERM